MAVVQPAVSALSAGDLRARRGRPARTFAVASLFSGAGGLDLGAEMTGRARTTFATDSDPWAAETYRRNLGDHFILGDVRDIKFPDVPADILVAGPPCQDYSFLWNHDGAKTERGNLFREVARFLAERQPKAFVLENVTGLLSANHGMAWLLVRHALRDPSRFLYGDPGARYALSASAVNFADFGVPQHRHRLIVLGIRRDLGVQPPALSFPFAGRHMTVEKALDEEPIPLGAANHDIYPDNADIVERLSLIPPGENYTAIPESHPLRVKGLISHVYRRLHPDQPSYTVIAGGGGGTHGYHHVEPRRLTNRERARLQTFPDSFVFVGGGGRAEYQRVRSQIGNAVPPIAAKHVVSELIEALDAGGVTGTPLRQIEKARRRVKFVGQATGGVGYEEIAN